MTSLWVRSIDLVESEIRSKTSTKKLISEQFSQSNYSIRNSILSISIQKRFERCEIWPVSVLGYWLHLLVPICHEQKQRIELNLQHV